MLCLFNSSAMKRIFIMLFIVAMAMITKADGLNKLGDRYKDKSGAVFISSMKEMDKLERAGYFDVETECGGKKEDAIAELVAELNSKGIKEARALILSECEEEVKLSFKKQIDKAIPDGYESLFRIGKDKTDFKVYVMKRSEDIKLLFIIIGNDTCGFVEIESENSILNSMLDFD